MAILEQLNDYMTAVLILTVVLLVVIAALYVYFFRIRKITAKEEKVNYSSFKRKDSIEFIKFKNILSEDPDNESAMGIVDLGNHTYVGGIEIVGYNFNAASAEEQEHTIASAIHLANIIDGDVQFRQSVRAVDLEENIAKFEEYKKAIQLELADIGEDYNDVVRQIEDNEGNEERVELLKELMEQADDYQRQIDSKRWLIDECDFLLAFMNASEDRTIDSQRLNQLFYTFHFNPSDYSEELSEEEISVKALQELRTMGIGYADAVGACGCITHLLTAEEFAGLLRQHCAPFGADDLKMEDLVDSSYNALYVSSDSLIKLEKQRRDEVAYQRQMEELAAKRAEMLHLQFTERERNEREIRHSLDHVFGEEGGLD